MWNQKINQLVHCLKLISLLALLSSCSNSAAVENWLAADPQLNDSSNNQTTETAKNNVNDTTENTVVTTPDNSSDSQLTTETKINLPADFPTEIPIYPQTQLVAVEPKLTAQKGKTVWRSPNSQEQIINYYQNQFQANNWQVNSSSSSNLEQQINKIVANRQNLEVTITINNSSLQEQKLGKNTEFTIQYKPTSSVVQVPTNDDSLSTIPQDSETNLAATNYFSDLDEVPEQLKEYVKDVAALGILTAYKSDNAIEPNQFAPNETVTRRDYARWLIAANNKYYGNSPSNKIHLATKTNQPAFQDISVNDPDFAAIQGLAEAGLIPSMLTSDSSKLLFRPNAPLTRQDLITWKVPLDLRKALPSASIDTIKQSWGFQDTSDISTEGLRALFADFQNGEHTNVSRIFGYTTLFQPKKIVTRAEAAASLWYFGFQGDGITAQEVFQVDK